MTRLIRVDERVDLPAELPVIALRDLVFFPYMVLPLLIGRPRSSAALDRALDEHDGLVVLLAQRDATDEDPDADELYEVGTVVRILQSTRLQDGTSRVVLEGLGRVRVAAMEVTEAGFMGRIEPWVERESGPEALPTDQEARLRHVRQLYEEYALLHERIPDELAATLSDTEDRMRLVHLMSGHLLVTPSEKQELLEARSLSTYLDLMQELLVRELEILNIEEKLDQQIRLQMDSDRRQHYLSEQLKAIHRELGEEEGDEWVELESLLAEKGLPDHARERADRELNRLRKLNPAAPEAAVIRTYLDWIAALPWTAKTEDSLDVERAAEILDAAHYGLEEVKERILDHIAVLSLVGELQGPILCLAGPPGVGKTSLGRSIAQALDREFIRVSLGGVRDEAEIRGHRRTYVGALPGRIIQGMRRSGSRNPVFLLDEVDKLAHDFHGDPGAALLEVLDPEQNATFTDHYLELEFDLSDVLFLATANTLQGIPDALRDRMEIIRIPGYLDTEKRAIGRRFLWPALVETHGLSGAGVELTDAALDGVIDRYTREAGVRELERRLARVARKLAREAAGRRDGAEASAGRVVGEDDLKPLLGPPPYAPPEREEGPDRAGIANGLAWTAAGGELLDVEVAVVRGSGELRLTGTLGDIMKESALAALTYARSRAARLGLDPHFHERVDIHIHIPEGATPKDGPSAGITMAVALISALTGTPSRSDTAMTGEITLRGRVLPVGGVKEKAVAALRNHIDRVILPAHNLPDVEQLPDEVREALEFRAVRTMDEVLESALTEVPGRTTLRGGEGDGVRDAGADSSVQISQ